MHVKKIDFFVVVVLSILSILILGSDTISFIANACFYVYLFVILICSIVRKSISFDVLWLIGFVFIVLSEMFFVNEQVDFLRTSKYMAIGNNVIVIFYQLGRKNVKDKTACYVITNDLWFVILWLLLLGVYIYNALPQALLSLQYGRYAASNMSSYSLFKSIVVDMGVVLPAFIGFYFRNKSKKWIAFLLSVPVFVILIMSGTRFPFLFSVLGYAIASGYTHLYQIKKKDLVTLVARLFLLVYVSELMKNVRVGGLDSVESNNEVVTGWTLPQKIVSKGSAEGLIQANVWLQDYCSKNGYTLGKQSAFIFYWWIPRKIWPNKPGMTGGWLPHLYGNYREGHSASVGIWGELYVDFGYFSFVFLALWGLLLKRLNCFCEKMSLSYSNSADIIKVALISPFVFFAVRSPITGFISLVTNIAIFSFIKILSCQRTNL